MMFSLGSGHSLTIPRHWNFMEFPEMNLKTKMESPASPDVTTNSMMTEQQKKAVIKIVRRSLKGLRNEAPSPEDEATRSSKLVELNLSEPRLWSLEMERKLLNRHVKFYQVSRRIGRAQLYVIRVLTVANYKSQMQQQKLSSSCSPSDACQDCKFQVT